MRLINKKGELVSSTSIEVIIGIAVAVVLVLLMVSLITPDYDENDEIAKSYFERLEAEIEIVDSGGEGEFVLFEMESEDAIVFDDLHFYLAYFGGAVEFEKGEQFSSSKVGKNVICVCVSKDGVNICRHCLDLDFYAEKMTGENIDGGPWVAEEGERMSIVKEWGSYSFYVK